MKDEGLYLEHILQCTERIRRYTADGEAAFLANDMAQDASLRNPQTLAESCTRLSPELRERRPEINWRGIAGFRNVVVHDYLGIDLGLIWQVITVELAPLAEVVAAELALHDAASQPEEGTL